MEPGTLERKLYGSNEMKKAREGKAVPPLWWIMLRPWIFPVIPGEPALGMLAQLSAMDIIWNNWLAEKRHSEAVVAAARHAHPSQME
jgi:hypothetical protein